jgi:hypothetical protein
MNALPAFRVSLAIVALSGMALSLTVVMQYRRVVLLRLGKVPG